MSHIPASAMPHAKPHDDHAAPPPPPAAPAPAAATPEVPSAKPAPTKAPSSGAIPAIPYLAIAVVGALAIGGLVAALRLRSEPPRKPAKAKGGRPRKHPKPD